MSTAAEASFEFSNAPIELLVVDNAPETAAYVEALRGQKFIVNSTGHHDTALHYLQRADPALIVTGTTLEDGPGLDICRAAKAKRFPPSVLVVTPRPEDAPDALLAGCDGVLLKPFTASLLVNRTSRLLRARVDQLRVRSARVRNKGAHLHERSELLKLGVTREWPATSCPYCAHPGVTSFDYASLRRAWYACLKCKKVWLAKRLDS